MKRPSLFRLLSVVFVALALTLPAAGSDVDRLAMLARVWATVKYLHPFVMQKQIDWDQASLQVGLGDPRGVARRATLQWRSRELAFAGGADDVGLFRTGLHAALPSFENETVGTDLPFAFSLELNGTRDLRFLPAAGETAVALASTWPHPSFSGTALPETRSIAGDGFTAQWRVQDFGRAYASQWTSADMNRDLLAAQAAGSSFGVSLIQPVDIY